MTSNDPPEWDLVLVGGGLQNGLIALAVLDANPNARVLLLERAAALAGNHTWSFHLASVPPAAERWFAPLVEHRWARYRVRFPELEKTLPHGYATCSSEHFARVLTARFAAAPQAEIRLSSEVVALAPHEVRLADGSAHAATLVVDARGPRDSVAASGYQKFVGLEVEVEEALDSETALLMDATVAQEDGFRFVYLLPFSAHRALVEDTYFADDPGLDVATVRGRVLDWLAAKGLTLRAVLRQEEGVLPMPWRAEAPISREPPLIAGYRGGWFHPATGYSVPIALRLACFIAERGPAAVFGPAFDAFAAQHEGQARFAHLLNELLFCATQPTQRWKVFRHFYALPDALTLRFYDLALSPADKRRMFFRRPPPGVNFWKAMKILPGWLRD